MKITQRPIIHVLIAILLALAINACDSNDDGTQNKPVASLSMPSSIKIAPANNNPGLQLNSQELINRLIPRGAVAVTDPGTDFSTDKAFVVIEDAAKLQTDETNYWLCLIGKFNYAEKLNQGPYNIVISLRSCIEKIYPGLISYLGLSDLIMEGTVESIRSDNALPHTISAWMILQSDNQSSVNPAEIQSQMLMEISIYHNVSPAYPYGHFDINLADVEDAGKRGGDVGVEFRANKATYQSFLINNLPVFKSASYDQYDGQTGGEIKISATSALLTSDTRDVGALRSLMSSSYPQDPANNDSQSALMEFNQNYALSSQFADSAQITANQLCLSRNELRDNFWGYNLYHSADGQFRDKIVSAGQRVDLTNNIDFYYLGSYGSIDAYSQSLGIDSVLPDGAVISDLNNNRQYTAHVAYGTLLKRTRNPVLLSDIANQPLIYFGNHPKAPSLNLKWIVKVDPATNDFVFDKKIISISNAEIESSTFDHDGDPLTPEIAVKANLVLTGSNNIFFDRNYDSAYIYDYNALTSPTNRSAIRTVSANNNITNATLFQNSITEVSLYCYFDCPKGGLTQIDVDSAATTLISELNHPDNNTTPWVYTLKIDGFKLLLYDNSNNLAVDASNLDLSKFSSPIFSSGKMSTAPIPVADITRSTLDQLNETYQWTSGAEFYNQMVTLTDSAEKLVVFDDPIAVSYTHDVANDINNPDPTTNLFHGKTFYLTYVNNRLSSLPYTSNGTDISFDINLVDGTQLSNTEGNFVTRAVIISKQLQIKPIEQCNNFNLEPLLNNNSLTLITDAEIPDVPFTASDRPTVNSPAIISR